MLSRRLALAVNAVIRRRALSTARPENVGIIAMEAYTPSTFVAQADLEVHDGVPAGKYSVGLGQEAMAFCYPEEDVVSMSLSSGQRLLRGYGVDPADVGFLAVGHESPVDKSKSVKTSMLGLFGGRGDIEGTDNINACYGGTAALLSAVAWVQSPDWDGRYAMVVAGDVAVYPEGAARPTGGAASVAMLVGPDAPIVLEPGLRSTYAEDAYDFYKPDMDSEYPRVDGHLSNECYMRALDSCNAGYAAKFAAREGRAFDLAADAQWAVFHQPYEKLVRKSFAWCASDGAGRAADGRDGERARVAQSRDAFEAKVAPSTRAGRLIGNSYCGSLYVGLLSLISDRPAAELAGTRSLMFSYGSGLIATMFSVRFGAGAAAEQQLARICDTTDLWARLDARTRVGAEEYAGAMSARESGGGTGAPMRSPHAPPAGADSDFVLAGVDEQRTRSYMPRFEVDAQPCEQAA